MPVNHMVWIKFNEGTTPTAIEEHLAGLRSLPDHVPGILGLTLGSNFTERARGFTHGVMVLLTDRDALAAYAVHPAHVAVASRLVKDAEIMALDFDY